MGNGGFEPWMSPLETPWVSIELNRTEQKQNKKQNKTKTKKQKQKQKNKTKQ